MYIVVEVQSTSTETNTSIIQFPSSQSTFIDGIKLQIPKSAIGKYVNIQAVYLCTSR